VEIMHGQDAAKAQVVVVRRKFPWLKFLAGILLFAIFHQLHDLFPNTVTAILAEGEQEAIFAHMKMLFYPYLILSIVDYFLYRRRGLLTSNFIYARLLILVSVPWMMISFFYVPDAMGIHIEEPFLLLFSILSSFVGVYTAIRLEEPLEATSYRPAVKALLIFFFICAIIIYTGFAFRLPVYDFFNIDH
jgi:hypothetical protein